MVPDSAEGCHAGSAERLNVPWPRSPFLRAIRRSGTLDPLSALAACRTESGLGDPLGKR
ncbi:MAG: hypothetical protein KY455_08980 [Euryarchaeota archaeon]|nr:hypothetical protein [Euryarchaeota archaeon]